MAAVRIVGLDELRTTLKQFPKALQDRAIYTGVRKAASSLRTAMRRAAYAAPLAKGYKRTNALRQTIRSQVGRKPENRGKAWVGIIPKAAQKGGKKRALYYYKTLEFGRKAYSSKRRGAVKGSPPLRPFFARAWSASRGTTGTILVEQTKKAIAYEAGKAFAKSKARGR